jgi:shikimate kinase
VGGFDSLDNAAGPTIQAQECAVQVVFLYGPPGVGKLTVGKRLAAVTGYKLVHNHLVVDLAASLFPHESDEYFRLLRQVRQDVFAAAAAARADVICTGVYRATLDQQASIQTMLAPAYAAGASVLFVQLACDRDQWLTRLRSADRGPQRKITDPAVALALLERFDLFATIPFTPHLSIDTTALSPDQVATEIADHLPEPPRR